MALRSHRLLVLSAYFVNARHAYSLLSPFSQTSFSTTIEISENSEIDPEEHHSVAKNGFISFDESKVLNELSDLLPIRHKPHAQNLRPQTYSQLQYNPPFVDTYLLPEDKLRGVFLQKLKGKTAVENALTSAATHLELNLDVVARVVNKGNLSGDAMVKFFNWAIKQDTVSKDSNAYHIILKALGRRKFLNFMVDKLVEMCSEGIRPNCMTLTIVMDSFIRTGRISKAVEMFGKLEDFGMSRDVDSLNVLLQCLCRRSRVGKANSLVNSMKGKIEFNCTTYNLMIGGWGELGRVAEMERSLKAMVEDGFDPDGLTYSYVINGLGKAGQIDNAVQIFGSMEKEGHIPDTRVYNAMITNYASVGALDESLKYYEQMLHNNCVPDVDTFTILIDALLKSRKVADALEMFEEMLDRGIVPTTGTVTSFLERLCSYGPPYAAMMIYNNARKAGCKISLTAYKLLLMRLSRFGKCGMLLKLWGEMQESGYELDVEVYEYIINGLCNNGQLDSAVLVMEESLSKGLCPSRLLYSKLSHKLLASNMTERAYRLFLKVKKARARENARRYWRSKGWHF